MEIVMTEEPKKPGPFEPTGDPAYRGIDPKKPLRYRDPKNARRNGPRQEIARIDDRDGDHWGIE